MCLALGKKENDTNQRFVSLQLVLVNVLVVVEMLPVNNSWALLFPGTLILLSVTAAIKVPESGHLLSLSEKPGSSLRSCFV